MYVWFIYSYVHILYSIYNKSIYTAPNYKVSSRNCDTTDGMKGLGNHPDKLIPDVQGHQLHTIHAVVDYVVVKGFGSTDANTTTVNDSC